jgi:hypothetical protein
VSFFVAISSDGHKPSITQKFRIKIRKREKQGKGKICMDIISSNTIRNTSTSQTTITPSAMVGTPHDK